MISNEYNLIARLMLIGPTSLQLIKLEFVCHEQPLSILVQRPCDPGQDRLREQVSGYFK